jgi:catechol 2,3-dioxygenase-like lactoylglutathione lyase family enzyme
MKKGPRLFRVALEVGDGAKAAKFYERLLGVAGRAVGGGRHYFDCGDVIVALVEVSRRGNAATGARHGRSPDRGSGSIERPEPAPENVYFAVANLAAVHERARALRCLSKEEVHGEPGGAIVRRPWGERSFYAVDRDGNPLCFVDARTLFTGRRG